MMFRSRRTAKAALRATLALLTAVFVTLAINAEETTRTPGSLVAELGSSDYSVRQRAMMELQAGGKELLPQIIAAVKLADSEVRIRAWSILLAHALSPRGEVREAA